jgi:release factor glutamine methyltransferase
MVKNAIKYLTTRVYKPLLVKYLSATRTYTCKGITLVIPPQVFHPAFFFSTRALIRFITRMPLQQVNLLELGAGSGLLSMIAAKKGANVTATDINPVAIEYLHTNSARNQVKVQVIQSDLFDHIPQQQFDIIAINPPYYCKEPRRYEEYAWYCGEQGEYFDRLFQALGNYWRNELQVLMVLSDVCNLPMIQRFAQRHGWCMQCLETRKNMVETIFIYRIIPVNSAA